MPEMQGEFAANRRKRQDGICHPDRVGAGEGTGAGEGMEGKAVGVHPRGDGKSA